MITKKQYCRSIVNRYKAELKCLTEKEYTDRELVSEIFKSTTLGIALEYLGVLDPKIDRVVLEYLSHRGGIKEVVFDQDLNESFILSQREFIEMLPDEIPVELKQKLTR